MSTSSCLPTKLVSSDLSLPNLVTRVSNLHKQQTDEIARRQNDLKKLEIRMNKIQEKVNFAEATVTSLNRRLCVAEQSGLQIILSCTKLKTQIEECIENNVKLLGELDSKTSELAFHQKAYQLYRDKMSIRVSKVQEIEIDAYHQIEMWKNTVEMLQAETQELQKTMDGAN